MCLAGTWRRVHRLVACLSLPCAAAGARRERNNNKHKRLFTGGPGALEDGQNLYYKTGADGVLLRSGVAVINPDGVSGIRCDCCNQVGGGGAASRPCMRLTKQAA